MSRNSYNGGRASQSHRSDSMDALDRTNGAEEAMEGYKQPRFARALAAKDWQLAEQAAQLAQLTAQLAAKDRQLAEHQQATQQALGRLNEAQSELDQLAVERREITQQW